MAPSRAGDYLCAAARRPARRVFVDEGGEPRGLAEGCEDRDGFVAAPGPIVAAAPGSDDRSDPRQCEQRIRKLDSGEIDALVLALCGLERLGKAKLATEILSREIMLPAVGQGALALECRAADEALRQLLDPLHDPRSAACVGAERAMLAALDGSCRTPIAGLAELDGDRLRVEGLLLKPDGSSEIQDQREGDIADAEALGIELGRTLRDRAGPGFWLG